jgi:heme O synthase-like polyprenyltransferase
MSLAERQDLMDQSSTVWNGGEGRVSDYVALLKPRVMSLVIFTAFVGMMLAPGLHPSCSRRRGDPVHRHWRRRFRCAEHVV